MLKGDLSYRDLINEKISCECLCRPLYPCPPRPGPCCCIVPKYKPEPFLSSYMEALANGQLAGNGANIAFDPGSADSVGNNITLNEEGTIFTINRTGLYLVEWSVNLKNEGSSDLPAIVGIVEKGEAASGAASSMTGSFASGTLINVTSVPFTIELRNYGSPISIENPDQWENTAASIRIVRFADGPSK